MPYVRIIRDIQTKETLFQRTWKEHEQKRHPQGIQLEDEFSNATSQSAHPADWLHATHCLQCDAEIVQRF
eukprot:3919541-Karenia_brevis.AAC.1